MMMKKGHDQEKLMKEFWLRPAFQKHNNNFVIGYLKWFKIFRKNRPKLTWSLLLFFSFLLISLLFSAGWIHDLAKILNAGYASQKALQLLNKEPTNTLQFPLDCDTYNLTNTCPKNYPKTSKTPSSANPTSKSTCPEYFRWIHQDLNHWKKTGITREMVEKARKTAHFRLVILQGKIYVEKFKESIQTRDLFTIWGIVQMMRFYPGKLPDLELMFDCDDRPVVQAKHYLRVGSEPPPPLFRYCSDWQSLDIVFPDWSFWGWAETNIRPWRSVLKNIREGNKRTKWEDRVPYAYWKGNPHVAPWRADLMKCNATKTNDWNTRLYVQDWEAESKKRYKQSNLGDQCTHRYKIYIEGWAWSVSEKYILACDSPTLLMTPRWYDFFTRGMIPQHHYWPVRDNNKCKSLKFAVEWGNNHTKKAKAIGEAGSRFIHKDLKMEYVYDYMFHLLNEYGKLLRYKPSIPPNAREICSESLSCSADGNWKKFMTESFEKSPSDSVPCTIPPPYEPNEFKAFIDEKVMATNEVEAWETEYWDKQNKKQ